MKYKWISKETKIDKAFIKLNNTKVFKAYTSIKQIAPNRYPSSWTYAVGLLQSFKYHI